MELDRETLQAIRNAAIAKDEQIRAFEKAHKLGPGLERVMFARLALDADALDAILARAEQEEAARWEHLRGDKGITIGGQEV